MAKGNISIKEISKLSGVSVATVSRVINQNGRFSKETEERVKRIIEENNYTPDIIARGLRTNKVQTVGIIVPDITNEFFAQITLQLQNRLFEMGYSTIFCNTNEVLEVERKHLAMLKSHKVTGLIYISGADTTNHADMKVPTIYIDRKPALAKDDYIFIESDNISGGYMATKELIEKGCNKIAMLTFGEGISSQKNRLIGYLDALKDASVEYQSSRVLKVPSVDIKSGYEAVLKLIDNEIEFDGLFCCSDYLAVGAVKALRERGISVPSQVKVVGFDDISAAEICRVPLTTIKQPIDRFAMLGANSLVYMMEGDSINKTHYALPVELIAREST